MKSTRTLRWITRAKSTMNLWERAACYALASASVVIFLIAITSSGQAQSESQASQKIAALEKQLESLFNKGDADRLGAWIDTHMLDDFTCIDTDGSLLINKTQARASFVDDAKQDVKPQSTEQKIRVIGNTAILTTLTRDTQGTFRRMDVWIRQKEDWRLAACAGANVSAAANTPQK